MEIATPRGNFDTAETDVRGPGVLRARAPMVLLVGDEEPAVAACAERLQSASIRVTTARTGFEAIVKACWHMPDVIAMQDGLSAAEGVDGLTAAQMLRTCPATAHIPIVAGTLGDPALLSRVEQELP
jgi:CheY-like chemotaxis protein